MAKRVFPLISIVLIGVFVLAACGTPAKAGGEVYYLNFKPEVADLYAKIGEAYQKETGVTLKVVTAASGTYEQTLKSEIAKADAPVLFQINGPRGYANWVDYCADLKNTELYKHLSDKSLAVTAAMAFMASRMLLKVMGSSTTAPSWPSILRWMAPKRNRWMKSTILRS